MSKKKKAAVSDERKLALIEEVAEAESVEELGALELAEFESDPEVAQLVTHKAAELSGEAPAAPTKKVKKAKVDREYKLLSFDVKWATQPQVLGIASVLRSIFQEGQVVKESEIIAALSDPTVERTILKTRQGGARIWHYYKGDHMVGLRAHGNIEVASAPVEAPADVPVEAPVGAPVEAAVEATA